MPNAETSPQRRLGYVQVIAASLLLSTSGLLTKLVFDDGAVAPRTMAALRVYGAAIVLAPLVIRARPRLGRRDWWKVIAFGVLGISVPQWIYFEAIKRIPVPIALVIVYTAPVIVTVFERVVHHRRLAIAVYLGIGLAVGGVVVAVAGGKGGAGAFEVLGIVLAIVTAFAYAVQIVVVAAQPAQIEPLARTGLGMMAGAFFWLAIVPPWRLPFGEIGDAIALGPIGDATNHSAPLGALLLFIVVFGTAVPYTLLVAGTPRIGLGASAVTGMLEPVFSSMVFWVVLDQNLTVVQSIGVAVALAGVTVAEILRNKPIAPLLAG